MRAVCQRVSRARVYVEGELVAEIGVGLCVLLGVARGDTPALAALLGRKVALLRVFADRDGRLEQSLVDAGGAALVVSQFTLIADTSSGNRPSFSAAAPRGEAEPLYEQFCAALAEEGVQVARGRFGDSMALELVNEGPVTIVLDARPR